jgi:uncharacterized protein YneR
VEGEEVLLEKGEDLVLYAREGGKLWSSKVRVDKVHHHSVPQGKW